MKRKLRLKPYVLPSLFILMVTLLMTITTISYNKGNGNDEDITYVSSEVFDHTIPVISTETKILKPYNSDKVVIEKNFYDYKGEAKDQEQSIIFYDNTYIPNSGVSYKSTEPFDIVCILDGTVTKISDNELMGKTIEIRHDSNLISIYQAVSEVKVAEGDFITGGQIIAKSGTAKIFGTENNKLHFELYNKGTVVNPESFYNKALKEIQ